MCVWKRKNYEMNKCLSLVHLTRRAMYLIEKQAHGGKGES